MHSVVLALYTPLHLLIGHGLITRCSEALPKGTRVSLSFKPRAIKVHKAMPIVRWFTKNLRPSQVIPLDDALNVRNHALSPLCCVMVRVTV